MRKNLLEPRWHETWLGDFVVCLAFGLLGIGVRWLFSEEGGPSVWEMVLTFAGTTIAVMIFMVRKRVAEIEIRVREHNVELTAEDEIDNLLMQLQTSFREVRLHRSAVFKTYSKQELESFVTRVAKAAQGEMIVNEHHFSTLEDVLGAFGGQENRVYRGVWIIEEGEPLFDTAWQHYMKELIGLIESRDRMKKITVELLLVVDKRETLDRLSVEIVVGYLKKKKGINYCIITEETYRELVSDSQLDAGYIDFGVYGDALLYLTKSYESKQGMFSEDPWKIRTYRQTHEAAMKSPKALADPTGAKEHNELGKFLQADELEEKGREEACGNYAWETREDSDGGRA